MIPLETSSMPKPMALNDYGKFSLDDDGSLLFEGKRVVTEQKVSLRSNEWWLAFVAAISAGVMAILDVLRFVFAVT